VFFVLKELFRRILQVAKHALLENILLPLEQPNAVCVDAVGKQIPLVLDVIYVLPVNFQMQEVIVKTALLINTVQNLAPAIAVNADQVIKLELTNKDVSPVLLAITLMMMVYVSYVLLEKSLQKLEVHIVTNVNVELKLVSIEQLVFLVLQDLIHQTVHNVNSVLSINFLLLIHHVDVLFVELDQK